MGVCTYILSVEAPGMFGQGITCARTRRLSRAQRRINYWNYFLRNINTSVSGIYIDSDFINVAKNTIITCSHACITGIRALTFSPFQTFVSYVNNLTPWSCNFYDILSETMYDQTINTFLFKNKWL